MGKIAALFPGQGSQSVGMGSDLFESSDLAQQFFNSADKALGFELSKLCFEGPIEKLTETSIAQPALLTVSTICFQEFTAKGKTIDLAAGHSLGEYSALVAAGVISFEDAVVLVHKRGRYMQEAVPQGKGGMLAVMGPSEQEIAELLSQLDGGIAEIANLNSPGQTVIAGDNEGLEACAKLMRDNSAKVIPLNVSAPFHCSLMKAAEEKLSSDLDAISFNQPCFPVYANVTAARIETGNQARELLKQQVCSSVRWSDTMKAFKSQESVSLAIEFGPGGVLTKLLKRIEPEIERVQVSDKLSLESSTA